MFLDTVVLLLLMSSVITLPRKSSKNKKIFARKGFTCRSMCKGRYDLCSVSADSINKQMLCFNSKLMCSYNCVGNTWKNFHLKRQTKVAMSSKLEKHLNWRIDIVLQWNLVKYFPMAKFFNFLNILIYLDCLFSDINKTKIIIIHLNKILL